MDGEREGMVVHFTIVITTVAVTSWGWRRLLLTKARPKELFQCCDHLPAMARLDLALVERGKEAAAASPIHSFDEPKIIVAHRLEDVGVLQKGAVHGTQPSVQVAFSLPTVAPSACAASSTAAPATFPPSFTANSPRSFRVTGIAAAGVQWVQARA